MKKEIITSVDPKSPVSEVFRTLRTNLQYLNKKSGAQTILITSTLQGEGKSFIAANLAVTFAQAGKSTIIVDTDMRRPRQHKLLDVDMYPGMSNYLSGVNVNRSSHSISIKDCIYKCKMDNIYVLPAGNIPPNPSELLQSEKLSKLIDELKKHFDVVIFDGAPCLLVTDATLVSRLVDATVLVTCQGKTKTEDLKEVKNRINRVGGKVVGVVLNRIKVSSKKYGEKYYYYSNDSKNGTRNVKKETKEATFAYRHRNNNKVKENDKILSSFDNEEGEKPKQNQAEMHKENNEVHENVHKEPENTYVKQENEQEKHNTEVKNNSSDPEKVQQILAEINKLKEEKSD